MQTKIHKLKIDSEKTKKIVENSVLISTIHTRMDSKNKQFFKLNFIHRNLYMKLVRQNLSGFRNAKEFEQAFTDLFKVDQSINRLNPEFKRKLDLEMQKFCGKIAAGDQETASEVTSATKLTKKSGAASPSKKSDGLDEAATFRGEQEGGTSSRGNPDFDPNPEATQQAQLDQEQALEEERMREEELKKKQVGSTDFPDLFTDKEGKQFDPQRKFGVIDKDGETLIYDDVTYSYPVNMPPEFYQKFIMDNLPKNESGNGKWFIRPHHLESLTKHPLSVKDDVLNTRYYSHNNKEFGKKPEVNHNQEAVEKLEEQLAQLKNQMNRIMFERGEDPDKLEEMRESLKHEAMKRYEAFINDRTRHNAKDLIVEAYEGVLTDQRGKEASILNQ